MVSDIKVTYLGHSGFMVETKNSYLIFDFIKGTLPDTKKVDNSKKWYIFESHAHEDHFKDKIFEMQGDYNDVTYILSYDIMKKINHNLALKNKLKDCDVIKADFNETIEVNGITVTTLKSTDEGVAFIVNDGDRIIYHAGDLNWWHWEEESYSWNRNMEVDFKREIDKMKGINIDVAFVPLDPRQEQSYYLGMKYFVENVNAKKIYPMHFWDKPKIIDRYIKEYGKGNIITEFVD